LSYKQDNIYIETPHDIVVVQTNDTERLIIDATPLRGPAGGNPPFMRYVHSEVNQSGSTVTLNANTAASFLVNVSAPISNIVISEWPSNLSQHISIYFRQSNGGYHAITGWPAATRWGDTNAPDFTSMQANDVSHVILNSFDGGNTIFATIIAYKYE
jgi:hypothetical protein